MGGGVQDEMEFIRGSVGGLLKLCCEEGEETQKRKLKKALERHEGSEHVGLVEALLEQVMTS